MTFPAGQDDFTAGRATSGGMTSRSAASPETPAARASPRGGTRGHDSPEKIIRRPCHIPPPAAQYSYDVPKKESGDALFRLEKFKPEEYISRHTERCETFWQSD
jgi:hypothetical protein